MKLIYVVLDGAPDSQMSPRKTLEEANKPNIDSLARNSVGGIMYTVAPGVAPESDVAVMSILGYDPEKYYTGRGPLEALGASMDMVGVAFRANFATVDPVTLKILDRRVGRSLTSAEARELARAIDGMKLKGGEAEARFKATVGHRGVLVISHGSSRLSSWVTNTDPAYERRGHYSVALPKFDNKVAPSRPMNDSPEARLTAELVNEFTRKAIEVLDSHEVNRRRAERGLPKGNAVLLRDPGDRAPEAEPTKEKFGMTFACIAEMPVEVGIARALGMKALNVEIEGRPREEVLREEALLALRALEEVDAVYVHLKGPDEPGHDGDFEGKVRAVEAIDRHFFSPLLNGLEVEKTMILVTSDHQTPWDLRAHGDGPVPFMISHPSFPSRGERFTESYRGTMGAIDRGFKLLPLVAELRKGLT
ncbi:MAG: 2,3-bisphosphoglycerate-independent phosphoglycerate mutase [Acidilobaceae archaeon]|nr:2,3-bisphosphoglycerate-independent phosphoglycerate mutase [Acidilobaceae archaeon]MCX8165610.1 2,3-bisphosphoglycerate-independent phosphoglycerate mutase [Acidilobaceae archaeon]MDW7974037.1 2,3-bisphosphoglycerate-independent phosphoglycerate mutase [Sulfolobales archaeon]